MAAQARAAPQAARSTPQHPFYGPKNQFWPHRIVWAIIKAFFSSIANTLIGLGYCIIHPRKSIRGIAYAVGHPRSTLKGIATRMRASLQRNGVFYTGTCAICMFILPGAGMFGKVAELSEHGRKASAMKATAGAPPPPPPPPGHVQPNYQPAQQPQAQPAQTYAQTQPAAGQQGYAQQAAPQQYHASQAGAPPAPGGAGNAYAPAM
jgi:hypothetical protein